MNRPWNALVWLGLVFALLSVAGGTGCVAELSENVWRGERTRDWMQDLFAVPFGLLGFALGVALVVLGRKDAGARSARGDGAARTAPRSDSRGS